MHYNAVLVRYDEIGLKGRNRSFFESILIKNIKKTIALAWGYSELDQFTICSLRGRIVLEAELIRSELIDKLCLIPGISSVSQAISIESNLEEFYLKAEEMVTEQLSNEQMLEKDNISFRVSTNRANKSFPLKSMDIDRKVAEYILPKFPQLKVDLTKPDLELSIDLREKTYMFIEKRQGLRGLPVGTGGRMLCLLSGGIDSPVAAFNMIKRGVNVDFVNFHSPPYIGEESKGKVIELAKILNKYQYNAKIYIVNFAPFQKAVKLNCEDRLRTILYRRAMVNIASGIANLNTCKALLTGEALGQVASQTIDNIVVIDAASSLPIIRPLISAEKIETISLAKKIGTYEVSILPYPDSCSVFAPRRPATSTTVEALLREEKKIEHEVLIKEAINGAEIISL